MSSFKRSADEAGLSIEEMRLLIEEKRKRIHALVDAEQTIRLQANATRNLELAEMAKQKAAAEEAAEEAAEQERKRKEEMEKTKRLDEALSKTLAEYEERARERKAALQAAKEAAAREALQRKAGEKGLPTSDLTVNKGTRYEKTYKVVWLFVSLLANGAPINDDDRMDMIEKLRDFLSTDPSYKDTWSRLIHEGIQLFSIQARVSVGGNWVLRVTYDGYVPDYNDECPHDDDQSDGDDWGEQSCFSYFDVDMYGRVENFDAPTGCYVKVLHRNESNGWMTIHSC